MMNRQTKKNLMTHIVIGYPSIKANIETIRVMQDAGVDYIELQIPFSDPIADGRTILNANQVALEKKITVNDCFRFAESVTGKFKNIDFLFMTYYNIVFNAKTESFIRKAQKTGMYGLIVPDIPPEEDIDNYYGLCKKHGIHPVCVFSPTTSDKRLRNIKEKASGFSYCTSRIGITGAGKKPHEKLGKYILKAKKIIDLPIGVGFGIDSPLSAKAVSEFADIIIIGSKVINIIDKSGKKFQNNVYRFLSDVKKAIS